MQSVQSKLLNQFSNLLHAFSTRENGLSKWPFSGNNLAFHVKDDLKTVQANHLNFSQYLEYPIDKLVYMNQIHGDRIEVIDNGYDSSHVPTCDALITNLINTPIMVMVADCIPVLIYDSNKKVIAVVHAGRAGIFKEIIPKTIEKMTESFDSDIKDIYVVLGPSIHACCYEIGEGIVKEAIAKGYAYAIKETDQKYYLDLQQIAYNQISDCGIATAHIETSTYCTSCDNRLFYSYRAEQGSCGRFCGVMMLKEPNT